MTISNESEGKKILHKSVILKRNGLGEISLLKGFFSVVFFFFPEKREILK